MKYHINPIKHPLCPNPPPHPPHKEDFIIFIRM